MGFRPRGVETTCLAGHGGGVPALCLLPDGRLASGSYDKSIRLRNIAAQCEITRLETDAPIDCLTAFR